MKIALLGSTTSIIPPQSQAAIERLAYFQTMGLANKGHTILLFTLSGSKVNHQNVRIIEVGKEEALLGVGKSEVNPLVEKYGVAYPLRLRLSQLSRALFKLIELKDEYDVILNNLPDESPQLPLVSLLNKPFFHILHLPVFPALAELFSKYKTPLISISFQQRKAFPDLNYVGNAYNAVDTKEFTFSPIHKNYLLYLGSIGKNKNPKDAILAAKQSGESLIIGGRIKDQKYYEKEIRPLIDGKKIRWVGEMGSAEVIALYQGAKAFLFPTMWEEPFGLVMIEAMACGTPVIAYPHGAVLEVVKNGVNGYLVNSVSEMADKIKHIDSIDRKACRAYVEEHFSINQMVTAYENILLNYKKQ